LRYKQKSCSAVAEQRKNQKTGVPQLLNKGKFKKQMFSSCWTKKKSKSRRYAVAERLFLI